MNAVTSFDPTVFVKRELSALAAAGVVTRQCLRRCFERLENGGDLEVREWYDNGASIEQIADMIRDLVKVRS